jgi:hypothetical protein
MSLSYWPNPADVTVTLKRRRLARGPIVPRGARKPLHLDGRRRTIEVRAAGAALAIERGERRITVPVARIARVLACGRVHWDASALALCLRQRVPVVLLDTQAQPVGAALPLIAHTGALDELLVTFLDWTDWRHRYDNWLRSQRLRMLLQWRRERARAGCPVPPDEWTEHVRAFVYRGEPDFVGPYSGATFALVVTTLLRAGVRSQYRAADGGTLALASDLARILDRHAALRTGNMAAAFERLGPVTAQAASVAAVEHEALVVRMLQRLRRCVAEWIEPWP